MQLQVRDLKGRIARLDRGLAKEVALWTGGNDPLLFAERRMNLKAIQDALAGEELAAYTIHLNTKHGVGNRPEEAERGRSSFRHAV
jgi:hypothetical protein